MEFVPGMLVAVERYCWHTGVEMSSLSRAMFDDGRLLLRLRDGYDLKTTTYERGLRWLVEHWPDGIQWPKGVVYPAQWRLRRAQDRRTQRRLTPEERQRRYELRLERRREQRRMARASKIMQAAA